MTIILVVILVVILVAFIDCHIDVGQYIARRIEGCQYVDVDSSPTAGCSVLDAPLDDLQATELADRLKALADPVRLRLLSMIATSPTGELCACVLPDALGRSQPTISHHLTQLVASGLLEREQRGKWAWFRLQPDGLAGLRSALGQGADHRHVGRPVVLFLTEHEADVAAMACGWMSRLAHGRIEPRGAATGESRGIESATVDVMREVGIEIPTDALHPLSVDDANSADVVVAVGVGGHPAVPPGARRIEWELSIPLGEGVEALRAHRDEIGQRVGSLIAELTPRCCA